MDDISLQKLTWLPELVAQVRAEVARLNENQHQQRPALGAEYETLARKKKGWSESLAKPDLPPAVRVDIEAEWAAAVERMQGIENLLSEEASRQQIVDELVDPEAILDRIERLSDVLAKQNPTLGNLELSLHIDKIICSPDGIVTMRTCKLGALTEAVDLLANGDGDEAGESVDDEHDDKSNSNYQVTRRRRGRLRVADADDDGVDMRALADFAADPERFAGLGEEWFWCDVFQIPGKPPSWAEQNAEAVFERRQKAELSYAKLGREFGVTAPTARAAVEHYLAEHPKSKDEVNLPRGGQRPPKFDLSEFGHEARAHWEAGWSKLKLAEKYDCSSPTIDKALAWSYAQEGRQMPTRQDRKQAKMLRARDMLDAGHSLEDIAEALDVSDVTARQYLQDSFAAEGKRMPDLRRRRV